MSIKAYIKALKKNEEALYKKWINLLELVEEWEWIQSLFHFMVVEGIQKL